jgi:hypothetical protein
MGAPGQAHVILKKPVVFKPIFRIYATKNYKRSFFNLKSMKVKFLGLKIQESFIFDELWESAVSQQFLLRVYFKYDRELLTEFCHCARVSPDKKLTESHNTQNQTTSDLGRIKARRGQGN